MVVEIVKSLPRSLSSGVSQGYISSPLFFLCLSMICVCWRSTSGDDMDLDGMISGLNENGCDFSMVGWEWVVT
jgi:hypothetical protein